ncbi:MAG: hypothetical protein CMM73_05105 [Rhodospirillaceae bacterium]|nr:hypothetical protein [Rhodospirillaceae bacterium]
MAGVSTKRPVIRLYHGEALFHAGQKAKQFYLVRQGCILVLDKAGARSRAVFTGGDILGIPEVLAGGNWALTAVASGLTSAQPFSAAALFQTLDDMPATHSEFLRYIAAMA